MKVLLISGIAVLSSLSVAAKSKFGLKNVAGAAAAAIQVSEAAKDDQKKKNMSHCEDAEYEKVKASSQTKEKKCQDGIEEVEKKKAKQSPMQRTDIATSEENVPNAEEQVPTIERWKTMEGDEAHDYLSRLLSREFTDKQYGEIVAALKNGEKLENLAVIVEKLSDAKDAQSLLEKIEFSGTYATRFVCKEDVERVKTEVAYKLLIKLVNKIDKDERDRLYKNAMDKAVSRNVNAVVFEGLYIGMPLIDFVSVVNKLEIADEIGFSSNAYYYDQARDELASRFEEPNWRVNVQISSFNFSARTFMKFNSCEDAFVLHQLLHKYVMRKTGECGEYEYLKYIKHQAHDEWTRRIMLASGNGATYEYNQCIMEVYSSTKYGVKIWYDSENGIIQFVKN